MGAVMQQSAAAFAGRRALRPRHRDTKRMQTVTDLAAAPSDSADPRPTLRAVGLAALPDTAAATRHRLSALGPALAAEGIKLDTFPFLSNQDFSRWYGRASSRERIGMLARASARAAWRLTTGPRADVVFVQREACFIGPELLERYALRRSGAPLVFDFDDAIWLPQAWNSTSPLLSRALRSTAKVDRLFGRASLIVAGSRYLADEATRRAAAPVVYAPSVVSARDWSPHEERSSGRFSASDGVPTIGWIGTPSTVKQLELVAPALVALASEGLPFRLLVIGGGDRVRLNGIQAEYRAWNGRTEVDDFRSIDIGLAPVFDDEWSRGKCAFKQIQYMTVAVPHVSSPVGAANEVVKPEETGLMAGDTRQWYAQLRRLLTDADLRRRLSAASRRHIEKELCLEVIGPRVAREVARVARSKGSRHGHV